MDRLNLIRDKAEEVLGEYRGPVFLFDVLAIVCLIIYTGLLISERTLAFKGFDTETEYVRVARSVASFFSIVWLVGISLYGSAWSRLASKKIYPLIGFLCVIIVECLEIYQRKKSWEPNIFLRDVVTGIAVATLIVMRLYRSSNDWKLLIIPALAALPLLSFTLWPRFSSIERKPIPYPNSTSLWHGTLLAAWTLAVINYGIPSYIQNVRDKVFKGALIAIAAGVSGFFGHLIGSMIAWFLEFHGSTSIAPYAIYTFVSGVFAAIFTVVMTLQLHSSFASKILTYTSIPVILLLFVSAIATSFYLQTPEPNVENFMFQDSTQSLTNVLEIHLAKGINRNLALTKDDPSNKINADHLRLRFISPAIIPYIVRRNITRFQVPWMLDGDTTQNARLGDIFYHPLLWIEPGDNTEASLKEVPARSEKVFVAEGPYQEGLLLNRTPAISSPRTLTLYTTLHEEIDMTKSDNTFKVALAYGGEIKFPRELLSHLTYLSRRIQFWKIMINQYVKSLGQAANGAWQQHVQLPDGLIWNESMISTVMKTDYEGTLKDHAEMLRGSKLPIVHIVGENTSIQQGNVQDLMRILDDDWLSVFETLEVTTDATSQMSITSTYMTSTVGNQKIDLHMFMDSKGKIVRPTYWSPQWDDAVFSFGPMNVDTKTYPFALKHMLMYLYSDAYAWTFYSQNFWSGFQGEDTIPTADETTKTLLRWYAQLSELDPSLSKLLTEVPLHKTLLRKVFHWQSYNNLQKQTEFYIAAEAVPLMYELLLLTRNGVSDEDRRSKIMARLKTHMAGVSDPHAQLAALLVNGNHNGPWSILQNWTQKVVEECVYLSLFLYVARGSPTNTGDVVSYPLGNISSTIQRRIRRQLWEPETKQVLRTTEEGFTETVTLDDPSYNLYSDMMYRYNNFGLASYVQVFHNFMWAAMVVIVLGVTFKKEGNNVLLGLFNNYEGLGQYRRYVYGAILVTMAGGLMQMLRIMRFEAWTEILEGHQDPETINLWSSTKQSLPATILYAASALYVVPGLVHQIYHHQLQTMFFLVLFFIFIFFAPFVPFLPFLPDSINAKWSEFGKTWNNRINALASGLTLLLLIGMVGFGFFDHDRPWSTGARVTVGMLLLVCGIFASPFYVFMQDFKPITQQPLDSELMTDTINVLPSDVAQFIHNIDDMQVSVNKGISLSLFSLLISAIITRRFLQQKTVPFSGSKTKLPGDIPPTQFVDN